MTKLREPRWLSYQRLRLEWFLGAALEDGEEVLARGRLRTGEYVVVTPRKMPGRAPGRAPAGRSRRCRSIRSSERSRS
jgi:hypothetical protein